MLSVVLWLCLGLWIRCLVFFFLMLMYSSVCTINGSSALLIVFKGLVDGLICLKAQRLGRLAWSIDSFEGLVN